MIPPIRRAVVSTATLLALQTPANAGVIVFDFETDPVLAATSTPDAWYPDRKQPAGFSSQEFLGDNRLQIQINAADYDSGNDFYNTQGRKYNTNIVALGYVQAELYVPSAWETNPARSDLWASGVFDDPLNATAFPVIGFTSLTGAPQFRVFDSSVGWVTVPTPVVYDQWYTFRIAITESTFEFFINGDNVHTQTSINGTTAFQDVMIQAFNNQTSYDVYWDNLEFSTLTIIPEPDSLLLLGTGAALLAGVRRRK